MAHQNDQIDGGIVKLISARAGCLYLSLYSDPTTKAVECVIRVLPNCLISIGDTVWWDGTSAYLCKESRDEDTPLGAYKRWTAGGE